MVEQPTARRPSQAWVIMTIITALIALAFVAAAFSTQQRADRPIGEGELFLEDASYAAERVTDAMDSGMGADSAIRHVRNQLTVEALSIVDGSGLAYDSTSETMLGMPLGNGLLEFGHFDRRFVAIAAPISVAIEVDGVSEWYPGDVVYQVLHPLDDGSSILMFYDISELLERRALTKGIRTSTLQLLGGGLLLVVVGAALAVSRARSMRRFEQFELESEYLRDRSADLERHNKQLDEALGLSEETNRVRAEFVLMINHELRTPLTGVVTGAELLASEIDEMTHGDRDRLLMDMVTDGRRLQEMIGQMLAVARVENRGLNFDLADISVSDLCTAIERKHARLRRGPRGENIDGLEVHTDVASLAQVAASLADNAITHGADDVWISCVNELTFEPMQTVGAAPDRAVYLMISDNGPGIDAEFLPRAFEKFEKLSRSSGTGLGLYLVAMTLEALGASLAVTTNSQGTTMAIAVPLSESSKPAEVST